MSPEQFRRMRLIFGQAHELPEEDREAFLNEACGEDADLRRAVQALLDADAQSTKVDDTDVEEQATVAMDTTTVRSLPRSTPGAQWIGPYRIIREIEVGGMGIVYEAEQLEPRRRVALKVIKHGLSGSQILARFETERQALAMMNHPNVAKVLDAGKDEHGAPYFAMEYIAGDPINKYCDRNRLSMRDRLELMIRVCGGVQHAHQKGIIHRDLSPSNVLIEIQDGRPVPRIIDFGIAKAIDRNLTERTLFTEHGQVLGKPEYMSPEQAEMTGVDIDTRTDVYSLGVMLYEILVGRLPFDSTELRRAGYDEMRRIIRQETPHKPSTRLTLSDRAATEAARDQGSNPASVIKSCRGDLDWITMKALEKDRTRRYASASELAADLLHHLNNEPVLAGPPSATYRLKKFVRRHRFGVATAATLTLAVVVGLVGTSVNLVRAKRAEAQAKLEAAAASSITEFMVDVLAANDPDNAKGRDVTTYETLKKGVEKIRSELHDQPELKGRLLYEMGGVYRQMGLFEEATPLLEQSVEQYLRAHGEWHPMTARSLSLLAGNSIRRQQSQEAIVHLERMRAIYEKIGVEDTSLARMETNFGAAYKADGQYELAIPHLKRAVEIYERMGDRKRSKPLHTLTQIYMQLGDLDTAQEYLERVVEINRTDLGKTHSNTLNAMNTLASLQRQKGDLDLARGTASEAIELQREYLGSKHIDLAYSLATLGLIERDAGNVVLARRHLTEALGIARSALGDENKYVLGLEQELAGL